VCVCVCVCVCVEPVCFLPRGDSGIPAHIIPSACFRITLLFHITYRCSNNENKSISLPCGTVGM
jgi:hypothetical protein